MLQVACYLCTQFDGAVALKLVGEKVCMCDTSSLRRLLKKNVQADRWHSLLSKLD
jgi:hypothetical protein